VLDYKDMTELIVTNNLLDHNQATYGGGIWLWTNNQGSQADLINNTIVENLSTQEGGGIWLEIADVDNSDARLHNNLILHNQASVGSDLFIDNDENANGVSARIELYHNDFDQSEAGIFSVLPVAIDISNLNNIDPLFQETSVSDYRLLTGSPVIDLGNNQAPSLPSVDIEGNDRIIDGDFDGIPIVDMGAHEYQELDEAGE
jgi:hypothetical protein